MKDKILVWDLPLRLFHWGFAVSVLGAWVTHELGEDYISLHMQIGYVALGLVIFRIIWGFIGPYYSQFKSFFPSPKNVLCYIKSFKSTSGKTYLGHNPVGSLSVFAMLFLILIQSISGLFMNDEIFTTGPYHNAFGGEIDKVMKFIHHNAFDLMKFLIFIHIGAIVYYKVVKKQALASSMITGKKEGRSDTSSIKSSKIILAIITALIVVVAVYWLVVLNVPEVDDFYY